MNIYLFLIVSIILILIVAFYDKLRQKIILRKGFPPAWIAILERRVPFFDKLGILEQQQLKDMIQLFIAKKTFHGCNGLTINDEIRITIAAQACLLLLNRKTGIYPGLQHILVYPYSFIANHKQQGSDGTISSAGRALLGESWSNGKVILSWDDVESGVADFHDGTNVVLHEFSHQLDTESGSANGAPILYYNNYRNWSSVFASEFKSLNKAMTHHEHTLMDYYGATNPAEFFAVATETFFEKPAEMAKRHPQLYQELRQYFRVNPADWQ